MTPAAPSANAWLPVPGLPTARYYPYIRKPDVLSSNSYIVRLAELFLLIDPGALPEQTTGLLRILAQDDPTGTLPLLILLTHCHLDHVRETAHLLRQVKRPVWLAAQDMGAQALAQADPRQTLADLYGLDLSPVEVQLTLLSAADCRALATRKHVLTPQLTLSIATEPLDPPAAHDAPTRQRQVLTLGRQILATIHPAPGHSPDSIIIQVGGLLFLGDVLAANRPLVAGIFGWSPQDQIRSLDDVIRLLAGEAISGCCPGHGSPLPAAKALPLLQRQRQTATQIEDVSAMTTRRLLQTVELAQELCRETQEAFAALAGRLLYVADRLDWLEEPAAAERCRTALDMDAIDQALVSFEALARSYAAGHLPQLQFAVEALSLVERIRRTYDPEPLAAILPTPMLNRPASLLLDFLCLARGTHQHAAFFTPFDLSPWLTDLAAAWQASPHTDPSIFETTAQHELFTAALIRRIGHPPPAARIPVSFDPAPAGHWVQGAPQRLQDTLIQFLEWLALNGAASIRVRIPPQRQPTLLIRPHPAAPNDSPRQRDKLRSFTRRFALAGFRLATHTGHFILEPNEVDL